MKTAIFPAALMKKCLEFTNKGFSGKSYNAKPQIICAPVSEGVICGSLPLKYCVTVYAVKMFPCSFSWYIDSNDGVVIPG